MPINGYSLPIEFDFRENCPLSDLLIETNILVLPDFSVEKILHLFHYDCISFVYESYIKHLILLKSF